MAAIAAIITDKTVDGPASFFTTKGINANTPIPRALPTPEIHNKRYQCKYSYTQGASYTWNTQRKVSMQILLYPGRFPHLKYTTKGISANTPIPRALPTPVIHNKRYQCKYSYTQGASHTWNTQQKVSVQILLYPGRFPHLKYTTKGISANTPIPRALPTPEIPTKGINANTPIPRALPTPEIHNKRYQCKYSYTQGASYTWNTQQKVSVQILLFPRRFPHLKYTTKGISANTPIPRALPTPEIHNKRYQCKYSYTQGASYTWNTQQKVSMQILLYPGRSLHLKYTTKGINANTPIPRALPTPEIHNKRYQCKYSYTQGASYTWNTQQKGSMQILLFPGRSLHLKYTTKGISANTPIPRALPTPEIHNKRDQCKYSYSQGTSYTWNTQQKVSVQILLFPGHFLHLKYTTKGISAKTPIPRALPTPETHNKRYQCKHSYTQGATHTWNTQQKVSVQILLFPGRFPHLKYTTKGINANTPIPRALPTPEIHNKRYQCKYSYSQGASHTWNTQQKVPMQILLFPGRFLHLKYTTKGINANTPIPRELPTPEIHNKRYQCKNSYTQGTSTPEIHNKRYQCKYSYTQGASHTWNTQQKVSVQILLYPGRFLHLKYTTKGISANTPIPRALPTPEIHNKRYQYKYSYTQGASHTWNTQQKVSVQILLFPGRFLHLKYTTKGISTNTPIPRALPTPEIHNKRYQYKYSYTQGTSHTWNTQQKVSVQILLYPGRFPHLKYTTKGISTNTPIPRALPTPEIHNKRYQYKYSYTQDASHTWNTQQKVSVQILLYPGRFPHLKYYYPHFSYLVENVFV